MKFLRKSTFVKFLAVFLCVVSLVSVAANGVLLIYMMYNNLYSNNEEALARKIYNVLAAETANDVYRYVEAKLKAADPNEDQYYWINEALTYESTLSEEYSNVSFIVSDTNGNIFLSGYELPEHKYEFAYRYVYKNWNYYDESEEDNEAYHYENATSLQETTSPNIETTTLEPVFDTTAKATENKSDLYTEQTTVDINQSDTKEEKTEESTTLKDTQTASEESTTLPGEQEAASSVPFDTIVNASQNQRYTYFTVTVFVPEHPGRVNDVYYFASRLTELLYTYKYMLIPVIVISALVFVFSVILLFSTAGYTKESNEPIAGGLHKIPFDLSALIVIFISGAYFLFIEDLFFRSDFIEFAIAVLLSGVLLAIYIAFIESIAVRIKTKTILSNNVIVRFYHLFRSAARLISKNISLTLKTALVFIGIAALDFIVLLYAEYDFSIGLFLFLALKFIELPLAVLIAYALSLLQTGAKNIAGGETNHRIEHRILIGELKKHAESLNSINQAVNKAVEERVKSENMKTELITNVSHDLKTPLTSIVNYIDLLKKTEVENDTAKEYIDVIDRQAQRLKKLTTDIVDASKAATGNIEVHFEKTLLNVMLSQVNGEYAEALEKRELTLIQQLPENDVCVMADGRLLWRVFDNLLNNICKYSQSYTRVYMTLLSEGTKAQIVFKNISSTPLNINPDELTERFVRGDTSRNTEGSGLGLSIAKSLCELMNAAFELSIDGDLFKVTITFDTIG